MNTQPDAQELTTPFHKHYESYCAAGVTDVRTMLILSRQGVDMGLFSKVGFRAETEEERATLVELVNEGIDGRIATELGTYNRNLHGNAKSMRTVKKILYGQRGYPEFDTMAYTLAHMLLGKQDDKIPERRYRDPEVSVKAKTLDPIAVALVAVFDREIEEKGRKQVERHIKRHLNRKEENVYGTQLHRSMKNHQLLYAYRILTARGVNAFEGEYLPNLYEQTEFRKFVNEAGLLPEQVKP